MSLISEYFLDQLFEFTSHDYPTNLLKLTLQIMQKFCQGKFNYSSFKSIQEDLLLNKISYITFFICQFCCEESDCKTSEQFQNNILSFINLNEELFFSQLTYLFDASFSNSKSNQKGQTAIAKCLFSLILLNKNIFEKFIQQYIKLIAEDVTQQQDFFSAFSKLMENIERKFDTLNEDKFFKNYKGLIKSLQSDVFKNSQNKIYQ
eukprot:TRINITY_DN5764_c0_g1_i1.p1 TRINITY_DN5764_c0_g1~~TRINITY_DN5764_c0_g1_i1.p1  ORF type:complete len:205 (+),score=34.42 TRINITY_DN5764_c0_g1_i1:585-1199(+)